MEAHDVSALLATFSDDIVLRSPITMRVVFRGRAQLQELMEVHFEVVRDVRYRDDALVYSAVVGRQRMEVVNQLAYDAAGLVREITVFVRPLPGLAALAAGLGPPLAARRRSRLHSLVLRALLVPLAVTTRLGDRLATRFT